jgi:hypothetical protein
MQGDIVVMQFLPEASEGELRAAGYLPKCQLLPETRKESQELSEEKKAQKANVL